MGLLDFARSLAGEYYDIVGIIRNYSSVINKTRINTNPPQNNFYPGFYPDKSYLLRQHQDRDGFNKRTRSFQYQKAMLKRMNGEIRGLEIKIEENIHEAFSRKIKSRRWMKRHHQIGRSCPYVLH